LHEPVLPQQQRASTVIEKHHQGRPVHPDYMPPDPLTAWQSNIDLP